MRKSFLFFVICFSLISWKWKDFSIKMEDSPELRVETAWVVDTVRQGGLRPDLVNNSPPLIQEELAVQGNTIDGVKAYNKQTGKLVWDFNIPSGVVSPLIFHKGNIYFGGADGFFYSLQFKSGLLNWKYFNAVENSGAPLIYDNSIYWLASNQKVYALDLKGSLLWIYSDSSLSGDFSVRRGAGRPAVYKNNLYVGLQNGSLIVLNRKTGQFKWKRSFSQPIIEDLKINKKCLLVPIFNSHLFCLSPFNGKTVYQLAGGSSVRQGGNRIFISFLKARFKLLKIESFYGKNSLRQLILFRRL
ncbi:MAG: PQQ-like beta-propeller repeat protein [Oligoflexia bacterium]|nr:PQQ-like beta-propeller repeat protein [Oligoflexia bacterium]